MFDLRKRAGIRRAVQALCLALFFLLLTAAAFNLKNGRGLDLFLILDPLSVFVASLASRSPANHVAPALIIALLTLVFGRFFCGYICPMGITVDITDYLLKKVRGKGREFPQLKPLRYIILAGAAVSAFFGLNLAFHFLPISLATRIYGLVAFPILKLAASLGLSLGETHLGLFGYRTVALSRFSSVLFLMAFIVLLFLMSGYARRFWCRYICPTGAFLGLLSLRAPFRLRVASACNECGACEKRCPVSCLKGKAYIADECVQCKLCVDSCPKRALKFAFKKGEEGSPLAPAVTRRTVVKGVAFGAFASALSASELSSMLYNPQEHGLITPADLVRPPGALPEKEFLALCVRCGECMVTCPTNGLQPAGTQGGSSALFSPVLVARRGPCDSLCARCGEICPTGAIGGLPLEEKQFAKMGTARVIKERCLAWAEDKSCVVCQEVCPYKAVNLTPEAGYKSSVPRVTPNKCIGCGSCEHACPVKVTAIVTEPNGALRLKTKDYRAKSLEAGLQIDPAAKGASSTIEPIVDSEDFGGLPPGFTE